jgi:pimeloyl-ACP methyl ester carboxylesterase
MPAFLVHGVPDTHRLWDRVREALTRHDVIAPDLPGFGCPLPDGFEPTKDGYAAWLIEQIEAVGERVDLVGHDWGSLLVQRVLGTRPDLLSTCAFGGGVCEPGLTWHDLAQIWQTPGAGEELMAAMDPASAQAALEAGGLPAEHAAGVGDHIDDTMKSCILTLYRSALDVFEEWAILEPVDVPTLVLHGDLDPYAPPAAHERVAHRIGAQLLTFHDCHHWWPAERPTETAAALERLWRRADPSYGAVRP